MPPSELTATDCSSRRNEIQEFALRIAAQFHPRRIILFGSHAYGRPTPDSDVDILVIMPHEAEAWRKAAEISSAVERNFPLDLLVRDPETLHRRIEQHDWFLKEIVERGEVIYEAAH